MKLDQLRKIIREEVRAAVKEELQEMLTEAVRVASTPETKKPTNMYQAIEKGQPKKWSYGKSASLDEMLQQTASEMTTEDYRTVINANSAGVQAPNFAQRTASQLSGAGAGLDLSTVPGLDLSRSKAILDAANKKTKERAGL